MRRSFRVQLTARVTAATGLAVAAVSVLSVLTLRAVLDQELNASILNVASIQAASVTDSPDGVMHFHEWELTPDEAASVRGLIRYAQVWRADGTSLLRSRFMADDLPFDPQAVTAASDGDLVWREELYRGQAVRSLYYPLARLGPSHEQHVLQVAAPLDGRNAMVSRLVTFFSAIAGLVIVSSFVGGWWIAGKAVGPIGEIIDQAEAIGAGSLDRRISAYADTREYTRLVEVLNTMLGRIESTFESQRRFTADASHELRSPLTAMRGELELALRRERDRDEYRRVLTSTLEEVERLSAITEELLTLARSDAGVLRPRPQPVEAGEVAERVVARLRAQAEARGVDLVLSIADRVEAVVDPGLLGQALWNLVENALKFTPSGGRVHVQIAHVENQVRIEVADTGPGLGEGPALRIFERFYRADEARAREASSQGTGLGLAIVKAVAEAHGGWVAAGNRPEGGAWIAVGFPAAAPGSSTGLAHS